MLKDVRTSKGMTQKQLAEKSHVKLRMIQHYEQGQKDIDHARIGTLCALAKALECKLPDILNDDQIRADVTELT